MGKDYTKNHFVPQGYLKGFRNENGKLFRLELNPEEVAPGKFKEAISEKSTKGVGFQYDLYTIFDDFVSRRFKVSKDYSDKDKFIEKECFKSIENVIRNVIKSIGENGIITDSEKSVLVDFIYISIIRNPKEIEVFKEFYTEERITEIIGDIGQDNAILEKMNMTPHEAKKQAWQMLKNEKRLDSENIGKIMIQLKILRFYSNSDEEKALFDLNKTRQFNIYRATGNAEFITSNYPAFFMGYLRKNYSVILPLNKRMMLEIDGKCKSKYAVPTTSLRFINDDNLIDLFNYAVMKNSCGEVYGSCKKTLERYENKDFQDAQELVYQRACQL